MLIWRKVDRNRCDRRPQPNPQAGQKTDGQTGDMTMVPTVRYCTAPTKFNYMEHDIELLHVRTKWRKLTCGWELFTCKPTGDCRFARAGRGNVGRCLTFTGKNPG